MASALDTHFFTSRDVKDEVALATPIQKHKLITSRHKRPHRLLHPKPIHPLPQPPGQRGEVAV